MAKMMKRAAFLLGVFMLLGFSAALAQRKSASQRADSLLRLMSIEEKVGQLNQISNPFSATGPINPLGDYQQQISRGEIGSLLNIVGAARTRQLQELARQSKRRIPLLFGQDVIHGYRTTFPIPLAEAASWDLAAIEKAARIAAIEASSAGLHWTFAPMVDISRDPRWGRVMEGAGEDAYLGSQIAAARVKGFQGNGFGDTASLMACAKHFAAYGAAVGGRDYNSADMSPRMLWEAYLPPFKAALDAGVATFMNSFNDLNGIPATGSAWLQQDILKKQWKFPGFVVSDWSSIAEMMNHGYAGSLEEAAKQAILAGNDVDMESRAYKNHLADLVKKGFVPMARLDDAVKRVVVKKFELGLFEDPFRFCSEAREKKQYNNAEHRAFARSMAAKSVVLLKNDSVNGKPVLPLGKGQRIALIGPLVKSQKDNLGFWSFDFDDDSIRLVSLYQAMLAEVGAERIMYAKGCNLNDSDTSGFAEARAVALQCDVVVMQVGEGRDWSGEAKSRSQIRLHPTQEALIKQLHALGKPLVVLISAGRPMVFDWTADHVPAILYTWWLGMEAGNAMTDVLYGRYNPSAKLPMSFPRSEGQIPIYYNFYNTGRPAQNDEERSYVSAYTDLANSPKYPFGYGLSYAKFSYAPMRLSDTLIRTNEELVVSVVVTNQSNTAGEEVVQLYLRDLVASVVRPVKELKRFEKVMIGPYESKTVTFLLNTNDLKFYNHELNYDWEPGDFHLMVGGNSRNVELRRIRAIR
jgi:beta-glucosidase